MDEECQDELKKRAAHAAMDWIQENYSTRKKMYIGVGSGSTVSFAFPRLAENTHTVAVPTSDRTEDELRNLGMTIGSLDAVEALHFDIDGADEVDPNLNLIKGGWGYHTREKRVAKKSQKFIVVIDKTKMVDYLGQKRPVPLEVEEPMIGSVTEELKSFGLPRIRKHEGKIFYTGEGNPIMDLKLTRQFPSSELVQLERDINGIRGVIENGIFASRPADLVFIGYPDRVEIREGVGVEQ